MLRALHRVPAARTGLRRWTSGAMVTAASRAVSVSYKTTLDFEPVPMKYFCDGVESDVKDEMRSVIGSHSVFRPSTAVASSPERDHQQTVEQLRVLTEKQLVTVSQSRTTPTKILSLYEVCAQLNGNLAVVAASQYSMFANIVSSYGSQEQRDEVLEKAGQGAVLGTHMYAELFTEESPLGTTAAYDAVSGTFTLSSGEGQGGSKFPVVSGLAAEYAIVVADVLVSLTNYGPHMFLVKLRDGKTAREGIKIQTVGRTGAVDPLGCAVVRFDNVELPHSAMFHNVNQVTDRGEFVRDPDELSPLLPLVTNRRLASAAIAVGRLKRLLHDLVNYGASREMVGPFGELNHPIFSVQHIQNRITTSLCEFYILLAAYHHIAARFGDAAEDPEPEDFVHLGLVSTRLIELMARVGALGSEICGVQGILSVSGFTEAQSLATILREGLTNSHVERLIAREAVTNEYGSKNLSSYVKNKMSAGFIKRFVSNPFFSPTSMDITRYIVLFNDREVAVRRALEHKYRVAQRNGAEDLFFMWNNEDHRDVEHLGNSYADRFLLETFFEEIKRCNAPENRRVLRDIAWQFSLVAIEKDLQWLLREQLFAPRHVSHLHMQLDNITSNIAHQAVNLVDAFSIPSAMKTSPLSKDWEAWWVENRRA